MRSRRFQRPGVSFFAFQDIITAVTGVMLLVALLMSLDIVKQAPLSVQADPELIAQRDALRSVWTDLQPRLGERGAAPSVADGSAEKLSRQNRAALVRALQEEAKKLEGLASLARPKGETVAGAAARAGLEESGSKLIDARNRIEDLTTSTEELEGKVKAAEAAILALKESANKVWVIPEASGTAKEPLIITVLPDSFVLEEVDSRDIRRVARTADVRSDLVRLLQGFGVMDHYAVLYFQPSSLPDFEAVKSAVSEGEGFEVGYDVVEDGKTVSFASKAGADEEGQPQTSPAPPREAPGASIDAEDLEARGEPHSSGSGFYISGDGFFVTNQHVVAGGKSFFVGANSDGWRRAKLVAASERHDLALLKVDGVSVPVNFLHSDRVRLGQTAATVGFPNIQLQGVSPKVSKGEISSLAGLQDDPERFQISLPVQPGNSGGVLFDESGNAIGVVSARINQAAALATTGAHAESVNYAIKSGVLLSWLASMKIPGLETKTADVSAESFEDAVQKVQRSAALILAYP